MAIDLSNRPKKERIVEMLQKRYRRKEIARRIPCSITYVNAVAKQAIVNGAHFDPPKRRVGINKRETKRLSVRMTRRLHNRIYQAAQLRLQPEQEPADIIRRVLDDWSKEVVTQAGLKIVPESRAGAKMAVLEQAKIMAQWEVLKSRYYGYRQEEGKGDANV